ncbi:MAG TPA: polysaccharide deacetylase family protein [Urbifossiella sp.]|nr:polysaccharide deacetylase family protein [Urbifossiella sp.]
MFSRMPIVGRHLPPGALCLTYDDGPGEQTAALAELLYDLGVPAAFFLVGREVEKQPAIVEQLRRWGHLVGNHTYSHPGLVKCLTEGGDAVAEIERTDALLNCDEVIRYLRPPYGNWNETVADALNRSPLATHYIGPIHWDICAEDWTFWERGDSARACADAYLAAIEEAQHGIILFHDSSADEPIARANNRSHEVAAQLIPTLLARYRFVQLDDALANRP